MARKLPISKAVQALWVTCSATSCHIHDLCHHVDFVYLLQPLCIMCSHHPELPHLLCINSFQLLCSLCEFADLFDEAAWCCLTTTLALLCCVWALLLGSSSSKVLMSTWPAPGTKLFSSRSEGAHVPKLSLLPVNLSASCLQEHRPTGGLPCTTGWAASHVSERTCGCLTSWVFNTLQNTCLCIQTVCPPAITFCLELQSSSDISSAAFQVLFLAITSHSAQPFFPSDLSLQFSIFIRAGSFVCKMCFVFTALYLCRTFFDREIVFSLRTALLHAPSLVSVSLPCLPREPPASQWATLFQLGFWPLHKDPTRRREKREPVVTVLNWPY